MNPTSHDAQAKHPGELLRIDQSNGAGELPVPIDEPDPTEELANEVTTELTNSHRWVRSKTQRAIVSGHGRVDIEPADAAPIMANCTVLRDRYVLEQQLGNGGTAVIFRAVDLRRDGMAAEGRRVAIKMLRPELRDRPQSVARLQREFRQTQTLTHPNVVRFHDLDCDRGTWFIVMELLSGEALGPRLRRVAPDCLPREETIEIAAATAEALAFAHDHGVTHGDVKPDNIFVTAIGKVRVLDFGVAPESATQSLFGSRASPDSVVAAATRAYASPEVLEGQDPEPRDDVFSLACVIYEMLAGRHPYGRRGADTARDSRLMIEPPACLAPPQWLALAAGLAWRREHRPDVRELMRALTADAPAPPRIQESP
ncbi:MAG: serine/threonine-protein kinase, partial [Steroidobacteraceae bacterium]